MYVYACVYVCIYIVHNQLRCTAVCRCNTCHIVDDNTSHHLLDYLHRWLQVSLTRSPWRHSQISKGPCDDVGILERYHLCQEPRQRPEIQDVSTVNAT